MVLDKFYPIFDHTDWLKRALPLGIKLVQLRIKDQPDDILRQEIRLARQLCADYDCQLVVNDYWQIAIDEGCDFIHLGQEDLDDANLDAIKAARIKLGVSTHDDAELERVMAYDPDYIALGPVWPTILKKMKWHQQGLERVTTWKKRIGDIPLCAIGGMTPDRALKAYEAGADIASCVTDITLNDDPEARISEWLSLTR